VDWKVLAGLGIAVAVIGSSSSKPAPRAPADTGTGGLSEQELLELVLADCKREAANITNPAEPSGVQWPQTVAAYNAAADLYEDGEDDPFELTVEAMNAMLPGCDWSALSETFTSEELGSALFHIWEAADMISEKVIVDEPVDIENMGKMPCPDGYISIETEEYSGGGYCQRVQQGTIQPHGPVEMSFNPTTIP
jgi:hypothetical protein